MRKVYFGGFDCNCFAMRVGRMQYEELQAIFLSIPGFLLIVRAPFPSRAPHHFHRDIHTLAPISCKDDPHIPANSPLASAIPSYRSMPPVSSTSLFIFDFFAQSCLCHYKTNIQETIQFSCARTFHLNGIASLSVLPRFSRKQSLHMTENLQALPKTSFIPCCALCIAHSDSVKL